YQPLTPIQFLERAATVFPHHTAIVHGSLRRDYASFYARSRQLGSALSQRGISRGDTVSALLPNTPAMLECHYGVPMCGAVLHSINTRLDAAIIAFQLDHAMAKVVIVDAEFMPLLQEALALAKATPLIIQCDDPEYDGPRTPSDAEDYEAFLSSGDPDFAWLMPEDEWDAITINYTSGTTGDPKGVVYHHRGAHQNAMGQILSWRMQLYPRYLTIVPLFHCNGWCHTWMMPAVGGTVVCCRDITAHNIYDAIADEGVTHFGGAPIVLNMLVNAPEQEKRAFDHAVEVFTAGAPPAPATLAKIETMGFHVTQVYGLTETYGPDVECAWQAAWEPLQGAERAAMKARQGVAMPFMEHVTVMDEQMTIIPADGETKGEIMHRGNGVMKGYLKAPKATREAFEGGYFHSGDIAVLHPDSYVQIADRAKDIIISGGENISSVEVENTLMGHEAVLLCAVVAKPDEKWGEVPCAFVELKPGHDASEAELIAFARERLAGFKTPKKVVFEELPKTSTGKIQKFQLRTRAKEV
uniref:acyl-CoA synthetase n=1 Tax=Salipiger bermudensis TaxID=344736 RepID=UPI0035122C33